MTEEGEELVEEEDDYSTGEQERRMRTTGVHEVWGFLKDNLLELVRLTMPYEDEDEKALLRRESQTNSP